MRRKLDMVAEHFPIAGRFTIARGSRTQASVVTVTLRQDGAAGRGECTPYARYGETIESVSALIASLAERIEAGLDRRALQEALPPGAARNALDCALWDLDAKLSGVPAHVSAGLDRLRPVTTAYTISLDSPDAMAEAAAAACARPILKIKLGAPEGDMRRIEAVRRAAPDSTLIADANEGWTEKNVRAHIEACAEHGFALVEQPLPASSCDILGTFRHAVPICADESLHDPRSLAGLVGRYDAVNIKLDKSGGLTEGLRLAAEAQSLGFTIMVGCMLGSSLAMAPAMMLTPMAQFVDLDAPLLILGDREPGLSYTGSIVSPPTAALWG